MSVPLLLVMAIIDTWIFIDLWLVGRYGMAVTFLSYGVACVALAWDVFSGGH